MRYLLLICFLLSLEPFNLLALCHDRQADPSTYIHGCVNAINGGFVLSDSDLLVEGAEALEFIRNFSGGSQQHSIIGKGFTHNHHYFLKRWKEENGKATMCMSTFGGDFMHYVTKKDPENGAYWFFLDKYDIGNGLTNTAQGEISARTNVKNSKIFSTIEDYKPQKKKKGVPDQYCHAYLGDGTFRRYKVNGDLQYEKRPNGNYVYYDYDKKGKIKRIYAMDPSNTLQLGELNFNCTKDSLNVSGSNGRKANYRRSSRALKEASATGKSHQFYTYDKFYSGEKKIIFLKKYEERGHGGIKLKWEEGRIGELLLIDGGKSPKKLFKMTYDRENQVTHVKGFASADIDYHYQYGRLVKKVYRGKKIGSTELFFWGDKGSYPLGRTVVGLEGNLITKGIGDSEGNLLTLTTYQYDQIGNVTKKTIAGHLTGDQEPKPFTMKGKSPVLQEREIYSCYSTHSKDMYNLLLTQKEDDGTEERYVYVPGTNKPARQFTCANGEIVKRLFFHYNTFGMLVETISDDGSGGSFDDLTNVTKRLITRIQPNVTPGTSAIGKPVCVTESYFDPKTGSEYQLKRVVYTYGIYDLVTTESHYDSSGEHAYTLEYTYDAHGNCIAETNALGEITLYTYNQYHQLIKKELVGSEFTTSYLYDGHGNVIQETEHHLSGEVLSKSFGYDLFKRKIVETDIFDQKTVFGLDGLGRLIHVLAPTLPRQKTRIEKKEYNIFDQCIAEIDHLGNVTRKTYNSRGQETSISYPDGSQELFRYNLNGTLREKTCKNGTLLKYHYDGQRRMTLQETLSPSGEYLRSRQFHYDQTHLLYEVDPEGVLTEYRYDAAGRKIAKICGDQKEEYAYDSMGRQCAIRKETPEGGAITVFNRFDALNRLIEERTEGETGEVFAKKTYRYDRLGNCIEETTYHEKERPSTIQRTYTSFGKVKEEIDPLGNTTYYHYDFNHYEKSTRVLQITKVDPLGISTVITKDIWGRDQTIEKKHAFYSLIFERFTYDLCGRKVKHTSDILVNGEKKGEYSVAWSYDSMGRVTEIVEGSEGKAKRTLMSYNLNGDLSEKVLPGGHILLYDYDLLGRKASLKSSDGTFHETYAYNLNDHLVKSCNEITKETLERILDDYGNVLEEHLPNGLKLSYTYDSINRITKITLPDASHIHYTYHALDMTSVTREKNGKTYTHTYEAFDYEGRSLSSLLVNGERATFTWDLMGRLQSIETPTCSEMASYDANGNLLNTHFAVPWGEDTEHYTYTPLNQLASEEGLERHTYLYDSLQNRRAKDEIPQTINTLNQLIGDGFSSYTYSTNGNLISDETLSYEYDALNRLTSVEKERTWRIKSAYDSFGRRITSTFYLWNNGWEKEKTENYLFQGIHEIGAADEEGTIHQLRILGKKEDPLSRVAVAFELNGDIYTPYYDHRFNVIALKGKTLESYRYTAYGTFSIYDQNTNRIERSQIGNPWLFQNKRYDTYSKLYNFGNRDYSPSLGRFITPDPALFADGMNLYAYTHNNPMVDTDFYGFYTCNRNRRPAIRPLFRNLSYGFGHTLSAAAFHALPPSIFQHVGVGIGRLFQGKSFQHDKTYGDKCIRGVIEGKQFSNARNYYVTGILTTERQAREGAKRHSESLGGHQVHYICHRSRGFVGDLLFAAAEFCNIRTSAIDSLAKTIQDDYNQMYEKCGMDFNMYVFAHSRGGLELYQASKLLGKEVRDQMYVTTLGSLKMIPDTQFKEVTNYCNKYDIVSNFARFANQRKDVNIVKTGYSSGSFFAPIIDHLMDSEGYAKVLSERGKAIQEREYSR